MGDQDLTPEQIQLIMEHYKLSTEEHDEIFNTIKRITFMEAEPTDNPIAIIIGGQAAAGKSTIISYSRKLFRDGNVVVINSDTIKGFYPNIEEVAHEHPTLFTKITDQESNTWTSDTFEAAIQGKYNLIFEGTMKNTRILSTIERLKEKGFTVIVRGMAVSKPQSLLSLHERYKKEMKYKGWGRLVEISHHNQTFEGMPNTISAIEKSGLADIIEIYERGSQDDFKPELIYAKHYRGLSDTEFIDLEYLSSPYFRNKSSNAMNAILAGRKEEERRVLPEIKSRLHFLMQSEGLPIWQTESEQIQLEKLQEELNNFLDMGDRD